jgi:hypothetical protein
MDAKRAAFAVTQWLDRQGIEYDPPVHVRSSHVKVSLRYNGKSRFVMLSLSASDKRAAQNQIRDVKRELRNMGWAPEDQGGDVD